MEIQTFDPFYLFATSALKPEPIECTTKIIMIGDAHVYHLLYGLDDDFKKIFKIRADFDSVTPKDSDKIKQYVSFIRKICDDEKLRSFEKSGVAAVVEYGVRLAGKTEEALHTLSRHRGPPEGSQLLGAEGWKRCRPGVPRG